MAVVRHVQTFKIGVRPTILYFVAPLARFRNLAD